MASERQEAVDSLVERLGERGATDPSVAGDVGLALFSSDDGDPPTATVAYVGEQETVRNAAREMDSVAVRRVQTEAWPGGEVEVQAEITVLDGGSGGTNPGGQADASPPSHPNSRCSTSVPPPSAGVDEQNPHVPPGGTFPLQDENGITDEYEVEVWPVRWWEPRPDVSAVLVLRYIPHERAHGLEWWSGYVQAAAGLAFDQVKQRVQEKRTHAAGYEVPVDWYGGGWLGWSEAALPSEMAGVPVYSTVPEDWPELSNHEAGDITEALAQATLEARREVLR